MFAVPVLFVQKNSLYHSIAIADCYDVERNALTYKSDWAVIAHPPCRLWSRMRAFSTAHRSERLLAVWAVIQVRKNGGVLEHPAGSSLFRYMNIPLDGSPDSFGGYLVSINQHWFGFPAQKRTYLYIVGISRSNLPALPLCYDAVEFSVSNSRYLRELPKSQRSTTPLMLCNYLIKIALLINQKK